MGARANGDAILGGSTARRDSEVTPQPEQVLASGKVHWRCTVCEERIVGSRAELDASGRCRECAP